MDAQAPRAQPRSSRRGGGRAVAPKGQAREEEEREKKIKYQHRVDLGIEPGTAVDRVQDEIFSTRNVTDTEDIRSSTLNASDSDGGSSGAEAGYLREGLHDTLEENLDYLYNTFKSAKKERVAMPTVIAAKGKR